MPTITTPAQAETGTSQRGAETAPAPASHRLQKLQQLQEDIMPYTEARDHVHAALISSQQGYNAWRKSKERPSNIPSNPQVTYAGIGWVSWDHWLANTQGGTGEQNIMMPFAQARELVHSLGLLGMAGWKRWCDSPERDLTIPIAPNKAYLDTGWLSWSDWFGVPRDMRSAPALVLSFEDARACVHALQIRTQKDYYAWSKSGKRPSNVPSNPNVMYREHGWQSWQDWLGNNRKEVCRRDAMLSFADAKAHVQSLGIRVIADWNRWCASGDRPVTIPSAPGKVYRDSGWVSWTDWFGLPKKRSRAKTTRKGPKGAGESEHGRKRPRTVFLD
jgi:hypothetical protein